MEWSRMDKSGLGEGQVVGFIQPTGFHKMWEISSLAWKLLASQEEVSCLESVTKYICVLINEKKIYS